MKAYYYGPEACGMDEFPDGLTRLDESIFERTEIPDLADCFVIPAGFHAVDDSTLYNLKWMNVCPERHVMLNVSDSYRRLTPVPMIFFRCDTTKWVMESNPWTIPLAWPVEDLGMYMSPADFWYDVGFVGWNSTRLNREYLDLIEAIVTNTYIVTFREFYGYLTPEQQEARRGPFLDAMRRSRLSLSVRSISSGVIRYRFYESLSMGRVPIHVNDGCVYPFADHIPYEDLMVKLPEGPTRESVEDIIWYLTHRSDEQIRATGQIARKAWLKWLDSSKWPTIMAQETKKRLEQL